MNLKHLTKSRAGLFAISLTILNSSVNEIIGFNSWLAESSDHMRALHAVLTYRNSILHQQTRLSTTFRPFV